MATVPQALIQSLRGVAGFDEAGFVAVHEEAKPVTSIRINPAKWSVAELQQSTFSNPHAPYSLLPVPWSRLGFNVTPRPQFTFDPLFHAGCYYVQEASSLMLEQALLQTTDPAQPLRVLDLCAAPGGKSTHLQSLLSKESLLVSNEVIRNRATILKQNIMKWGAANVVVTNNDPQHFARFEGFFDVLVVDAPCSGSGLFRREPEAVEEWSLDAVQLCCGRQKRILADAMPALKEGGLLIYSTCSYSVDEDEAISDWLVDAFALQNISLELDPQWRVVETVSEKHSCKGYRFFPHRLQGEGFYLSLFRKTNPATESSFKEQRLERATAAEKSVLKTWIADDDLEWFRQPYLHGLLKKLAPDYAVLKQHLNIVYAGVAAGEVLRDKLIPDHALALSTFLREDVPSVALDYETAIKYLQRNDFQIDNATRGWQRVTFESHSLGWINALPNRINNYYPKDWRILRAHPGFEK